MSQAASSETWTNAVGVPAPPPPGEGTSMKHVNALDLEDVWGTYEELLLVSGLRRKATFAEIARTLSGLHSGPAAEAAFTEEAVTARWVRLQHAIALAPTLEGNPANVTSSVAMPITAVPQTPSDEKSQDEDKNNNNNSGGIVIDESKNKQDKEGKTGEVETEKLPEDIAKDVPTDAVNKEGDGNDKGDNETTENDAKADNELKQQEEKDAETAVKDASVPDAIAKDLVSDVSVDIVYEAVLKSRLTHLKRNIKEYDACVRKAKTDLGKAEGGKYDSVIDEKLAEMEGLESGPLIPPWYGSMLGRASIFAAVSSGGDADSAPAAPTMTLARSRRPGSSVSLLPGGIHGPISGPKDPRLLPVSKEKLLEAWQKVADHPSAGPFQLPVTEDVAPRYFSVIKRPMDLSTLKKKVEDGVICRGLEFSRDMLQMLANAQIYNQKGSDVFRQAQTLKRAAAKELESMVLSVAAEAAQKAQEEAAKSQEEEEAAATSATKTDDATGKQEKKRPASGENSDGSERAAKRRK